MAAYKKPVKKADVRELMALVLPMIENGKNVKLTVTGYSMYPLVTSRRDAVLLAKAETLAVGDVPLFQRNDGNFILHRIVKEKDGAFVTIGDYETEEEYPVYRENIVAKAVGFYRKGKFIDCNSKRYKIYSRFWMKTVKIRPFLLRLLAKAAYIRGDRQSK